MSKKICKLCQSLEDYELKDNYHLYIYSDHEYTLAQIKSMTQDLNNKILQSHDSNEVVELRLSGQEIGNLGSKLFKKLSARELSDTKAFLAEREMSPIAVATSMSHITSLYKIISIKESRWLSNILKKQSLMSYFQPVIKKNSKEILGFEGLLRANYQQRIIYPDQLYNAAKSSELLFELDREARKTTIEYACSIPLEDSFKVFVNFNPAAIYNPNYCLSQVGEVIKKSKFNPGQIVFEVVESDFIKNPKHLLSITEYYKDHGYQIALDDLGSGYSSLNLLAKIKPDYIKIDMGLIRNIHQDQIKKILVQTISEFAHDLDIEVIAEGVESKEELEVIQSMPINYYQGFYFSKPKPPSHWTSLSLLADES